MSIIARQKKQADGAFSGKGNKKKAGNRFLGVFLPAVLLMCMTGSFARPAEAFQSKVPADQLAQNQTQEQTQEQPQNQPQNQPQDQQTSAFTSSANPLAAKIPSHLSGATYRNEQELFPLIMACQDLGMTSIPFTYDGDPSVLDLDILRDAACAYKVHLSWTRVEGTVYECTLDLTERHGRCIISALRAGDLGRLTDKERELYGLAMDVVREAEANCDNAWEKELYLFDWICSHTVYNEKDASTVNDMEDYLTAYGVFYDGSANCQGYTDAFYLLGNLAGMNVDMQDCISVDGGGHITNTIQIDGRWMIVDVTIGDDKFTTEDEGRIQMHSTFNVGKNRYASEAEIRSEVQRHPIFEQDTADYYYNHTAVDPWFGYQTSFTDLNAMANMMVERWYYYGENETEMILLDQSTNWEGLSPYLYDAAMNTGLAFHYFISCMTYDNYTLFRVTLS